MVYLRLVEKHHCQISVYILWVSEVWMLAGLLSSLRLALDFDPNRVRITVDLLVKAENGYLSHVSNRSSLLFPSLEPNPSPLGPSSLQVGCYLLSSISNVRFRSLPPVTRHTSFETARTLQPSALPRTDMTTFALRP